MDSVVLACRSVHTSALIVEVSKGCNHSFLSGNHCVVKVGHSNAVLKLSAFP